MKSGADDELGAIPVYFIACATNEDISYNPLLMIFDRHKSWWKKHLGHN